MTANKKRITAVIVSFAVISLCGMTIAGQQIVDHTAPNDVGSNMLNRAALIDDENSMLIGKEVQDDTPLKATNSMLENPIDQGTLGTHEVNGIVNSFADKVVQPVNITNFETTDDVTPEVIIPNGSAAIFGKSTHVGWTCNVGDELIYHFEKYPSEVVNQQTLVVGYILDGVMYPGEKFLDLEGEYRYKVEENGEYFIYVLNAASDPLALENGNVYILESGGKK